MYPGDVKLDLTETLLELTLESATGENIMHDGMHEDDASSSSSQPQANEILEDLHPPDEDPLTFEIPLFSTFSSSTYHYTVDQKDHVLSVVSPPPEA